MTISFVPITKVAQVNPKFIANGFSSSMKVAFVPMASVSEKSCSITSHEMRNLSELLKGYTPFQKDDVLLAKITPCFENGKIAIADISTKIGFGTTEFHVFRPDVEKLSAKYLYYILRSPFFRLQGKQNMTGSAGQKRVPADFVKSFKIPLPPLDIQRKIAAVLDRADAIRRKRQAIIAKLDELLQSVFLEMFGDPVINPKGWEVQKLGELIIENISGGTPSKSNKSFWTGDFPWVSPKDMKTKYIYDGQDHITESVFNETNLKKVPINTILLVVRGMILAHSFPVALSCREIAINQDMKGIIADSTKVLPEYLLYHFVFSKKYLLTLITEATHGTKRLETRALNAIKIMIPPLKIQMEFISVVKRLNSICLNSLMLRNKDDALFNSLLQRAFKGELKFNEAAFR